MRLCKAHKKIGARFVVDLRKSDVEVLIEALYKDSDTEAPLKLRIEFEEMLKSNEENK